MSGETIVRHCSPTLAGMKTGSLFACKFEDKKDMTDNMRYWNQILVKKGLRMLPLKYENKRALVYVFRVSQLQRDLADTAVSSLLENMGYDEISPNKCIDKLMSKLKNSDQFPHEIGLFLGYPVEDVTGFIEQEANGYKYIGPWKVYGDVDRAKKLFNRYRKCTNVYSEQFANGNSIEKLTVCC